MGPGDPWAAVHIRLLICREQLVRIMSRKRMVRSLCPECGCRNARYRPTQGIARCTKCKTVVPYIPKR